MGCKVGFLQRGCLSGETVSIRFASPKTIPSKGTPLPGGWARHGVLGSTKVGPSTIASGHRQDVCHPRPLPWRPAALWGRTSFPAALESGSKCSF